MKTEITDKSWPKHTTKQIETRKRDLVIRIADWSRQSIRTGEPAYDVEIYNKGIYDFNQSKSFTLSSGLTKLQAQQAAVEFAQKMIAELL
jgi:hypothetical protein